MEGYALRGGGKLWCLGAVLFAIDSAYVGS